MAKNIILGGIILLLLIVSGTSLYLHHLHQKREKAKDTQVFVNTTPTSTQAGEGNEILDKIKELSPKSISWSQTKQDSLNLLGKNYSGTSLSGSLSSIQGFLDNLNEQDYLIKNGWVKAPNLAAGGSDGGGWGYLKGKELLFFTFKNNSFVPPPNETKCPCNLDVKVIYANNFQ